MDTISGRDFAAGKLQKVMKIFFILPLSLFLVFHLSRNVSFFFSRFTQTICVSQTILPFPNFLHVLSHLQNSSRKRKKGGRRGRKRDINDFSNYRHEVIQARMYARIIVERTRFAKGSSLRTIFYVVRGRSARARAPVCGSTIQTEPIPLTWVGRWILVDQ